MSSKLLPLFSLGLLGFLITLVFGWPVESRLWTVWCWPPEEGQVWSITQFHYGDFSQSRIGVNKCVVFDSFLGPPRLEHLLVALFLCSSGSNTRGELRAPEGRGVSSKSPPKRFFLQKRKQMNWVSCHTRRRRAAEIGEDLCRVGCSHLCFPTPSSAIDCLCRWRMKPVDLHVLMVIIKEREISENV